MGAGPNVTVVDTPGFKDTEDAEFIEEMMNVLGDEVKEVDSFLIVYKYKDRFTRPFKRTLAMITKMFGNFWSNVVLVVNFWSFKKIHVQVYSDHPNNRHLRSRCLGCWDFEKSVLTFLSMSYLLHKTLIVCA